MDIRPDTVFRRMELRRRRVFEPPRRSEPVQAVYVPQNVRAGSYVQLMRSHDRMGTRHL